MNKMAQRMEQPNILAKSELKAYTTALSSKEPSGPSLRYEKIYDQIQTARKQDDNLPQGVWKHERKTADWAEVTTLCEQALKHQSKDLQIAAWLTEAWLHKYGLYGLSQGLVLIQALMVKFWDSIHPYSHTDPEYRLAPLTWLDQFVTKQLTQIEVTAPTHEASAIHNLIVYTFWDYQTQVLKSNPNSPSDSAQKTGPNAGQNSKARVFYEAVNATPVDFYLTHEQALTQALGTIREIESFIQKEYTEFPSILLRLRQRLEQMHHFFTRILKDRKAFEDQEQERQTKQQEDNQSRKNTPVENPAVSAGMTSLQEHEETLPSKASPANHAAIKSPPALEKTADNPPATLPILVKDNTSLNTRAEAYQQLGKIADYLETLDPHSLTPLLLRRAIVWGNMSLTELISDLSRQGKDIQSVTQLLNVKDTPDLR